ncbi:MAG: aspartate aminotransferase family protein [Candidatus Omnitrophica bacterium]|nr:aspartate aminotransferase family protein [Candidatus Omnitrophota bacterium]
MASLPYPKEPRELPKIETAHRRIQSPIPHPDSLSLLKDLEHFEARSMQGQPPIIWHKAERFNVEDPYGNRWIDLSSGVLVANAGHGREEVRAAMEEELAQGLHHCYCFPHQARADLARKLIEITPDYLDKVFLLTTGSEATECAIKLARTHGVSKGGDKKKRIVTFNNAFHGRTLGAQLAGGIPSLKEWIHQPDPTFVQVPFPDGYANTQVAFEDFLGSLEGRDITADDVAGVMLETYQGATGSFAPVPFMEALRAWCDENEIVLILDEVQAGFGRCGKWFGFMHYGIEPDIICCGKGISSGMPLSAVIGRQSLMDQFGPGEMTSTHSGNPVCCRAALASVRLIESEGLVGNSECLGELLHGKLAELQQECSILGCTHGKGLIAGVRFVRPGTKEPNGEVAHAITQTMYERGVLTFSPVGPGGGTIKLNPPLCITQEALEEALGVFSEIVREKQKEIS